MSQNSKLASQSYTLRTIQYFFKFFLLKADESGPFIFKNFFIEKVIQVEIRPTIGTVLWLVNFDNEIAACCSVLCVSPLGFRQTTGKHVKLTRYP